MHFYGIFVCLLYLLLILSSVLNKLLTFVGQLAILEYYKIGSPIFITSFFSSKLKLATSDRMYCIQFCILTEKSPHICTVLFMLSSSPYHISVLYYFFVVVCREEIAHWNEINLSLIILDWSSTSRARRTNKRTKE